MTHGNATKSLDEQCRCRKLGVAYPLGFPQAEGVGFHPLLVGAYVALMPATHPLVVETEVTPSALRSERLRLPKLNERNEKTLFAWCGRRTFSAKKDHEALWRAFVRHLHTTYQVSDLGRDA